MSFWKKAQFITLPIAKTCEINFEHSICITLDHIITRHVGGNSGDKISATELEDKDIAKADQHILFSIVARLTFQRANVKNISAYRKGKKGIQKVKERQQ